jgi:type II secretory pathway pseudopilin PulG
MLRLPSRRLQGGDTLIEVLFAFTILSLVIVGAMTIMNQGTLASQRSLETTLVRQQIDSQATTLRFLHDAYVAAYQTNVKYDPLSPAGQWQTMADDLKANSASSFDTGSTTCQSAPPGAFILNGAQAKYIKGNQLNLKPASTYAQVTYDDKTGVLLVSEGMWIEGIRSQATSNTNADNARFIDFHIRACWNNPGQGPVMTIGTIVRLYEPRG